MPRIRIPYSVVSDIVYNFLKNVVTILKIKGYNDDEIVSKVRVIGRYVPYINAFSDEEILNLVREVKVTTNLRDELMLLGFDDNDIIKIISLV